MSADSPNANSWNRDAADDSPNQAGGLPVLADMRLLDGGYCLQLEYLSGHMSFRMRPFHAMFLHFRHPTHGEAVIDTGYGSRFLEATRRPPACLHRIATPVPRRGLLDPPHFFACRGVEPRKVKTVFLSHFHADHLGGLRDYPEARVVCDGTALAAIRARTAWGRLKAGFLPALLPDDLAARLAPVNRSTFVAGDSPEAGGDAVLKAFRVCDYWGDGSLLLVDLPGHALGHLGFLLNMGHRRVFYAADAYWDIRVLRAGRKLPMISQWIQYDWPAYLQTQQRLRVLLRAAEQMRLSIQWFATHCPTTYKERSPDAS